MYANYYWQNDKVRLRLWLPKHAECNYLLDHDSDGMSLVHEEVTLPPEKQIVDENGGSAKPNIAAPSFSIENLDGEYIGHIHFNYINERHGTFSIGMITIRNQRGKGVHREVGSEGSWRQSSDLRNTNRIRHPKWEESA